jgi:leucyl-tRNA synthetase
VVRALYKDALKVGFYELQVARDSYIQATAHEGGMHVDLARLWIRVQTLLALPIIPHYAEHIWTTVLGETSSVQHARWPEQTAPVDQLVLDASNYVNTTIKRARDAETVLTKKKARGRESAYDPGKRKNLHIFVARWFPDWQDAAVAAVKEAYDEKTETVDKAILKEIITKRDLIKDKRVMPFCIQFEVRSISQPPSLADHPFKLTGVPCVQKRISTFGAAAAFNRTVLFDEREILENVVPYIERSLSTERVEIFWADDAMKKKGELGFEESLILCALPGEPHFSYYNTA